MSNLQEYPDQDWRAQGYYGSWILRPQRYRHMKLKEFEVMRKAMLEVEREYERDYNKE
jgi:hypothetical protein